MTAYSYNRRFVNSIRIGLGLEPWPEYPPAVGPKLQTIRALRLRKKDGRDMHAMPGGILQHYTGMRTAQCRLIARATCEYAEPIILNLLHGFLECRVLPNHPRDIEDFARRDGFDNFEAMRQFWSVTHPRMDVFEGVLITWKPIDV